MKKVFILLMMTSLMSGCYYDNEEELYPNNSCDTDGVTFSGKIVTIMENNCYTCHSTSNYNSLGGGLELEGYAKLKIQVDNGLLKKAVNHEVGASPMPKGSSKLNQCNVDLINAWIANGALNN